jgi:hypothetical protein
VSAIVRPVLRVFIVPQKQCHDAKLSDPFYDSLDGLLQDLRMVTMVCLSINMNPNASKQHAG